MYSLTGFPAGKLWHNITPGKLILTQSTDLVPISPVSLVVICLCGCAYFYAHKLYMFSFIKFSTEGHQSSFVFLLLERADRDFSSRNQNPPCSVLFPTIAWKCSALLHKKQSATPENKWWFGWFFCLGLLYQNSPC